MQMKPASYFATSFARAGHDLGLIGWQLSGQHRF